MEEDDKSAENCSKGDVNKYIGSSLIKQDRHAQALKNQAKALTGMPLINYNLKGAGSGGSKNPPEVVKRPPPRLSSETLGVPPNQIMAMQQRHLSLIYAQYQLQQHASYSGIYDEAQADLEGFVPRVIKPRKRRKPSTKTLSSSSEPEPVDLTEEFHIEDEMHLLPTDLLADEAKPTSKPLVRHTESFHLLSSVVHPDPIQHPSKHHSPLRKTFSWTNNSTFRTEGGWPDPEVSTFSLFPKTNQSDLLSSVRSDLLASDLTLESKAGGGTTLTKTASNLEQALKSLNIDNSSGSSRKF